MRKHPNEAMPAPALSEDQKACLAAMLAEADVLGVSGLAFQHIVLCPTRTWLHHHRIDCGHLSKHMQLGTLLHDTAYEGTAEPRFFGIAPDRVDWRHRGISEVKKSRSHEAALINQLYFYLAVLTVATNEPWRGILRYPANRRTKPVLLDSAAVNKLLAHFQEIQAVLSLRQPPAKEQKSVCKGCSYRILCWGEATEDEDA